MTKRARDSLVLVVDDNPNNISLVHGLLSQDPVTLAVANDGDMALAVARSEKPDLILLDVMMPGIDGYAVCEQLKADEETRDIPVIFMTALNETSQRIAGFRAGAVDFISKPFQEDEFLARVRTHLTFRRLALELQQQKQRLVEQLSEMVAAEKAREQLMDRLREANQRLETELQRREEAEAARARLQEEIIAAQNERMIEMSTPLIPITQRIVVMPLIGTLDERRAQTVLETALVGAAARQCEFIILDATGVRELDAGVAVVLARVAGGLGLLGVRTIITGISAEAARVLVAHDVSLGAATTLATLQDGIAHAMAAVAGRGGPRGSGARREVS